ncbi:MAG: VCBS repeat-containing protein [Alteromonadaceae bacterium TMED7]|nr:MAG: VCBS repeat-containing protein [Alteromonadaceae bacterium TMED7]
MFNNTKHLAIAGASVILAACGGGGGSDSGGPGTSQPPTPTPTQIIANAKDYSATQLNNAGRSLANSYYTGQTTDAELTPEVIQRVVLAMFGEIGQTPVNIPSIADEDFTSEVSSDGSVNATFMCNYGGTVNYDGKVDGDFLGNLTLRYANCENENDWVMSGSVAVTVTALSDEEIAYTVNFAGLNWTIEGQSVAIYGTQTHTEAETNTNYAVETTQYLTFDMGEVSLRMDSQSDISYSFDTGVVNFDLSGDLYFSDAGKVNLAFTSNDGLPPYSYEGLLTLIADTTVTVQVEDSYLLVNQDIDNDGTMDTGTYLASWSALMFDDISNVDLVSLDILSRPPQVYGVDWHFYEVLATTPVQVSPGYYYDPDTPEEELEISYNWYVNGVLLEDQHSNVLPAGIVVHNDTLEVAMVVSDGANHIQGYLTYFEVGDSPAQVELQNVPETVSAGSQVQFTARIVDPDVQGSSSNASLVAGPENASIDEDGLISWDVPDNFLFPQQRYEFTFGWPDNSNTDTHSVSIEATSDNTNMLVRSSIEVPYSNDSLWVADFDGDGNNELLTTDSSRGISLINVTDTGYQQSWMYGGELGVDGAIKNVMAGDINGDDKADIVVATAHGVSTITDLNGSASPVYSNNNRYVIAARLADIDGDSIPELFILSGDDDYSDAGRQLDILSFASPATPLFTFDLDGADDFAVANVDNDGAMELIVNTGLVYDLETGENQWYNGSGFSSDHVAAGDINGDGVAEIFGASRWGAVTVYDARDRSQLASIDDLNICDLYSFDIDQDNRDELITADCQWGEISAYSLSGSSLVNDWRIDMIDHGGLSLTAGDADNDGELELFWSTGISTTGEDILASADITNGTPITNQQRVAVELDYFTAAGWADLLPGDERAVFFIPSSSSGYDGGRILTMDSDGITAVGDELSSNWDNSASAVTADFNNDGAGDIFVPTTETYDGAISVIQLHDGTVQWSNAGDYDSDIGVIRAIDMNNDGYDDLVYEDSNQIKAVDVQNQLLLASYTFSNYISDFTAYHDGTQNVAIVSYGERLSLLTRTSSSFAEQSFIDQRCDRLELINYDTDSMPELLCVSDLRQLSYHDETSIIVFELNDNTLTEVQRTTAGAVLDVVVDVSTENEQGWFLAVQEEGETYNASDVNRVAKFDHNGFKIWSGTQLVGQPTRQSMRTRMGDNGLEILLGTSAAMYWLR